MPKKSKRPTPDRLMQMAWGYTIPLTIEAAIRHRVFDVLNDGPKTVEQLADECSASTRGLRAILNMLVSLEFLKKDRKQRYALMPESAAFLVTTTPSFQGGLFKHVSQHLVPRWLQLTQIVKTGKPEKAANQEGDGAKFFEQFVEDIFPMSYAAAGVLGDALKLGKAKKPVRVLDLAAGSGVWGIALAQKSSKVSVTAVDWEGVLPVTRRIATKFGLESRFSFVAGDILTTDFGGGHDIATLGHILHSEGEPRSRKLLKKTFDALASGGTIAIAEFVTNDDHTGPVNATIFAVNMLVNSDFGDTFSFREIGSWLREAGFKKIRSLKAPAPSPLILATKP